MYKDNDRQIKDLIEEMTAAIRSMYMLPEIIRDKKDLIKNMDGLIETDNHADIKKTGETSFCISVNKRDREYEQKWQAAHMLAKLFLDMGFPNNEEKWQNANAQPETTRNYYNYFAGSILMPKKDFMEQLDVNTKDGKCDSKVLAEHFHVNLAHVHYRGVSLGVFRNF